MSVFIRHTSLPLTLVSNAGGRKGPLKAWPTTLVMRPDLGCRVVDFSLLDSASISGQTPILCNRS